MIKYIRTYDNVLPMNLCKTLIDKFEQSQDQCQNRFRSHRHFTEININQHSDCQTCRRLYRTLKPYITKYKEDCKITKTQCTTNML